MIHPTSVVDPGAKIGAGTAVWHFSHIMAGAVIGERCVIGQNCYVASTARVGDGCRIQNNVSLYDGVELESDVFIGPSAVFTNVTRPRAGFLRGISGFEKTLVRSGATIGANATVVCGVTVGKMAFVGAGAVVKRDVPDCALVIGVPATVRGWVCACGETLSRESELPIEPVRCVECGRYYGVSTASNATGLILLEHPSD
ncbi:MAG: N-acetyltransferase [Polyangiaceae bacterium]|nr:N-acetyltransferase [Polyangiaceae bacterium]